MIAKQSPIEALEFLKRLVPGYYVPALNEAIRALKAEEVKGVIHKKLES